MRDLSFNADARTYVFCLSQDNTVVTVPEVTMLMLRTKIILSIRLPYVENWEHNSDLYVLLLSILYYVQHWPYSIGTTYVPIVLVPLIQLPYYGTPYYCTYITARIEGG